MFRASRTARGDDPWLRMLCFAIAAVLGLAGILFDSDWLVNAAIGVLAVAMLIGIAGRRRAVEHDDDAEPPS